MNIFAAIKKRYEFCWGEVHHGNEYKNDSPIFVKTIDLFE